MYLHPCNINTKYNLLTNPIHIAKCSTCFLSSFFFLEISPPTRINKKEKYSCYLVINISHIRDKKKEKLTQKKVKKDFGVLALQEICKADRRVKEKGIVLLENYNLTAIYPVINIYLLPQDVLEQSKCTEDPSCVRRLGFIDKHTFLRRRFSSYHSI
jgi:hypothetical protein